MPIPAWWGKANIEDKKRAVRLLNRESGAISLGVRHLPAIPDWQEAKGRLLTGDRLHRFSGQMRAEEQERREIIEQFAAIEKWRDGATLPPDVRICRYKKCPRFFLFRKNWRIRFYCSKKCGGNYRASKSMNRKIQNLRERKLKRVRIALKTMVRASDWKKRVARKVCVSQNFITYAIRRGELIP
jgi:hypothetical protein